MGEPGVVIPKVGERFVGEDGSVSVVLADTVDEDYVPTQEEIEGFAEWMGMNLPEDNEFLHIAVEGLKAPLPKNWRPCRTEDDEVYYFNFKTGESTWCHPMDEVHRERFRKAKEQKQNLGVGGTTSRDRSANIVSGTSTTAQRGAMGNAVGSALATPTNLQGGRLEKLSPALGTKYAPLRSPPLSGGATTSSFLSSNITTGGTAAGGPLDRGSESGGTGGGKRRFVSETEEALEKRIRQEREEAFLEEQKKAEATIQERRMNMQRSHEEEVKKLRAETEAKLAELRANRPNNGAEAVKKKEMEALWTERLDEVKREGEGLEKKLASLREENEQRIAAEVKKIEAKASADLEAKVKRIEADGAAALEKAKREAQAALSAKKNELQKKAREELEKLKKEVEKQHSDDMAALERKFSSDGHQSQVKSAASTAAPSHATDVESRIAAIREKEKQEVSAIQKRSEEEKAALRRSMDEAIGALRREIHDIQQAAASEAVPAARNSGPSSVELEEVRRRWRAEEARRMQLLAEDRRAKVLAQEKSLETSSSLPKSSAAQEVTADQSLKMRAILTAKEKEHQETEALLRSTLQEELTRTSLSLDAQLEAAVADAFKVFVRSTEVSRRFEKEDFERRRASNSVAQVAKEGKGMDSKPKVSEGASFDAEELLQKKVEEAVGEALQNMRADHENALRRLRQRYEEERRMLIASVDEEVSTMEEKERQQIDQKLKGQTRDYEPGAGNATTRTAGGTSTSIGVPLGLLQQRLTSIEAAYSNQIQDLEADLMSLNSAIRMMDELPNFLGQRASKNQETDFTRCGSHMEPGNSFRYVPSTGKHALPTGKGGASPSTMFSSEARLFLAGQFRDFSARRDALQAAREEWYANAMEAAAPVPAVGSGPLADTAGLSDVHTHMISLIGSLGGRLERIMRRVNALQAYTEGKRLSPPRQRRRMRHGSAARHDKKTKSTHKKHRHAKAPTGHPHGSLIQKWSRILSELSSPPVTGGELSAFLRHLGRD
ncbi:hypothetical protein, conserved [Trypanosoma brucei brucei TREU927]|uniref:WW domain-containing protein n=1 Tax=Trypanosoma brucei brucei (strain 927/4 GUTat10.1) TaxID=185431 RepID=Q383B5_TRYB2|nr:hypothetical protein, conserved [Trypanosoma brucei brucei TREU927]EAN80116.1 hypothetical protein, conserved [Trypanosoma brucei brucei TREU927]